SLRQSLHRGQPRRPEVSDGRRRMCDVAPDAAELRYSALPKGSPLVKVMKVLFRAAMRVATLVLVPSAVLAQGSITGSVRDTTNAVLPGVTVEASSPVLIERARSVVTDNQGAYKIVDLRPGTYVVTFTLAGFSTVKREGIELTGTFTAIVNADLR